jgi:glutathione S-transferase
MRTRTLYGLTQSPWTQRARWALDHHGVIYRYHEHLPMMGELLLRRAAKLKDKSKKASVPLLVDGDNAVMGSFEIAKYAESNGRGAPLFPRDPAAEKAIAHWNDVAERMTNVGRVSVFKKLPKNRAAQKEALPSFVPGFMAGSASMAISFLAKKYAVPTDLDAEVKQVLRPALEELRAALAGKAYLLDGFTYADITVACALQAVRPHDRAPLGPGTRETWTNEEMAAEFEDLLMWRDAIYRKHR